MKKTGVDKTIYGYSTRDAFVDFRSLKDKPYPIDRKEWNRVVDAMIVKLKDNVVKDKQIFTFPNGVGKIQMVKDKVKIGREKFYKTAYNPLLTDGWKFFLNWNQNRANTRFKNRYIYRMFTVRTFRKELYEHIVDCATDPYKRDYNTILSPHSKLK